ncbi:type II toxin-antitoxin system RelE/ParE family toxin [Pedobacter sp. MR2016-19]|uniref:type II toxin-antitoxin system RelE/ParE family toxin n=1 Tax=Pedobacter sp. MR2016-19 TaxID=2780089 RepID=UPI001874CCB0|nr:type II toxin-antitoxin system RelE/ParE family toxin [Pedobacter sp. MR2016-19]
MVTYHISKPAQIDLEDIWLYTFKNWSKDQVDRYYSLLLSECEYISNHFEHGKVMDHILMGYRCSAVKSHLIFYKLGKDGLVEIIRILHQMTNIKSHLL